jgi:hypothetical protein
VIEAAELLQGRSDAIAQPAFNPPVTRFVPEEEVPQRLLCEALAKGTGLPLARRGQHFARKVVAESREDRLSLKGYLNPAQRTGETGKKVTGRLGEDGEDLKPFFRA